jgi:urease accessory protein UreF
MSTVLMNVASLIDNRNRYRKFLVAVLGAVAAVWGPDASQGLAAFLTAVGVYVVPNET